MTANLTTYPPATPEPAVADCDKPVTWCREPGCDYDTDWHHAHGDACKCPDCRADRDLESFATRCTVCGHYYSHGGYQQHKDFFH